MSEPRLRLIVCATTLVLLASAARADAAGEYRTIEEESLRITVDSEWIPSAAAGYLPVRWDITNLGADRTIEIAATGNAGVQRALPVPARAATSVRQRLHAARRGSRALHHARPGQRRHGQRPIRDPRG